MSSQPRGAWLIRLQTVLGVSNWHPVVWRIVWNDTRDLSQREKRFLVFAENLPFIEIDVLQEFD
jgi:hypothetical protein